MTQHIPCVVQVDGVVRTDTTNGELVDKGTGDAGSTGGETPDDSDDERNGAGGDQSGGGSRGASATA